MLLKKCLFTILWILEVGKIFEKQVAAEKGHLDFYIGGLRHFHAFALVVEENFMHNLPSLYCFLGDKKKNHFCKLYTSSPNLIAGVVSHELFFLKISLLNCFKHQPTQMLCHCSGNQSCE